jgi:hypothetical protein
MPDSPRSLRRGRCAACKPVFDPDVEQGGDINVVGAGTRPPGIRSVFSSTAAPSGTSPMDPTAHRPRAAARLAEAGQRPPLRRMGPCRSRSRGVAWAGEHMNYGGCCLENLGPQLRSSPAEKVGGRARRTKQSSIRIRSRAATPSCWLAPRRASHRKSSKRSLDKQQPNG